MSQSPDPSEQTTYIPVGETIADYLRKAIIGGTLEPGERIRQEALAEQFGVSRLPVREALRHLEREGLVSLIPHRGATVARLDFDEHLEIYLMREALEPVAISKSALRITDDQLTALKAMADDFEHLAPDPERWLEADRRFHLATYAPASLPRLLEVIEGFWNTTQHYRRAYLATLTDEDHELVYLEHRMILEALERRDPLDAESRQRSHIRRTRLRLTDQRDLFVR